jgi:hypothetical protein
MGASVAVCAKFSAASAACVALSCLVASSLEKRFWKGEIHCCCRDWKAGVYVVIERGFARRVLDGVELMARAAVRRRRYLQKGVRMGNASDHNGGDLHVG